MIRTLTPDARVAFTYICLMVYGYIFAIFTGFYGIAMMLRGYLIFRSRYLPRTLGGIVFLAGTGFIVKNVATLFAPQFDSMALVAPMLIAMLSMAVWLLVKGINFEQWERRAQPSRNTI